MTAYLGGVKLAKNADSDKYVYTSYGIGFDLHSDLSLPGGSLGKNVIIFGVNMSSYLNIGYKGKDILTLNIGPTQGLDVTIVSSRSSVFNYSFKIIVKSSIVFNSFLFVNARKIYQFKAQDSEIKNILCV